MTQIQSYTVWARQPDFEVRRYDECVVAEVTVPGPADAAGRRAFRALAGYIGGRNTGARSIAMTAPVLQEPTPAPRHEAHDTEEAGSFVVGFVMPAGETLQTLPAPKDPTVRLRAVPVALAAAMRYSGRWTEQRYARHLARLRRAVADAGLEVTGEPQWARYDPPTRPWFLRRNEVLLPIAAPAADPSPAG